MNAHKLFQRKLQSFLITYQHFDEDWARLEAVARQSGASDNNQADDVFTLSHLTQYLPQYLPPMQQTLWKPLDTDTASFSTLREYLPSLYVSFSP